MARYRLRMQVHTNKPLILKKPCNRNDHADYKRFDIPRGDITPTIRTLRGWRGESRKSLSLAEIEPAKFTQPMSQRWNAVVRNAGIRPAPGIQRL